MTNKLVLPCGTKACFQQINFEDNGQDYLEWITLNGLVIDSQPFQQGIWSGNSVTVKDGVAQVQKAGGPLRVIKHQVDSVTEVDKDYIRGFMDSLQSKSNYETKPTSKYTQGYQIGEYYLSSPLLSTHPEMGMTVDGTK